MFEKNGKNYVFLQIGERFDRRDVKVVNRTESRAVVTGLNEGDVIALVDPDVASRSQVVQRSLPRVRPGEMTRTRRQRVSHANGAGSGPRE